MFELAKQIRVVLIEPTHPGNIGAVARAMKTMGLVHLILVKPKKYPHYEASKRAAGAEDVLDAAEVVDHIDCAIANCTKVYGTSVRDREVSWPTVDPSTAAQQAINHVDQSKQNQIAILFGRESSGLTNQELDLCQSQIRISANTEYSSLNLASAVQIITYEMRVKALALQLNTPNSQTSDSQVMSQQLSTGVEKRQQAATKEQFDGYMMHLKKTLEALDFSKTPQPTLLMRKLTRLYNKADLTVEEIQILRGILSAVQSQLDRQ